MSESTTIRTPIIAKVDFAASIRRGQNIRPADTHEIGVDVSAMSETDRDLLAAHVDEHGRLQKTVFDHRYDYAICVWGQMGSVPVASIDGIMEAIRESIRQANRDRDDYVGKVREEIAEIEAGTRDRAPNFSRHTNANDPEIRDLCETALRLWEDLKARREAEKARVAGVRDRLAKMTDEQLVKLGV